MGEGIASGRARLSRLLSDLKGEGGFAFCVLADAEGFPLAWAPPSSVQAEKRAAVVALIHKMAGEVRRLDLGRPDEITFRDRQGRRLICRPFQVGDRVLILAVLVPGRKCYRLLTRRAIRAIRLVLEN